MTHIRLTPAELFVALLLDATALEIHKAGLELVRKGLITGCANPDHAPDCCVVLG